MGNVRHDVDSSVIPLIFKNRLYQEPRSCLLLEKGIAVVPGGAYGQSTDQFIRISIAAESEEKIYQALTVVKQALTSTPIRPH